MIYELRLPWPPSLNRYYRAVGSRVLISSEGRRYREEVIRIMRMSGVPRHEMKLRITIHAYPPDRRRRDIDNLLKATFDALQHGGAYSDDSQIVELHAWKHEPIDESFLIVTIEGV